MRAKAAATELTFGWIATRSGPKASTSFAPMPKNNGSPEARTTMDLRFIHCRM